MKVTTNKNLTHYPFEAIPVDGDIWTLRFKKLKIH